MELLLSDELQCDFCSIDVELIISKRQNFSIAYRPSTSQIWPRWSSECHLCSALTRLTRCGHIRRSLSTYLDALDMTYFNELLIRRLFVPFMFLCPITRSKLLPRILIPKDESNASWISPDTYRCHAAPLIIDLFSYHVASIRETLLGHFNSYWELIDRTSLVNTILPQVRAIDRNRTRQKSLLLLHRSARVWPQRS